MKKLIALILCLATVSAVLASCGFDPDEKGAIVNMYLFNEIRNFDPLYAYTNASNIEYDGDSSGNGVFLSKLNANAEAVELLGLLYEGLFKMNADGKVEKALAKSYEYIKKEDAKKPENNVYMLRITLRDTRWSDNTKVQANDFIFTVKRILDPGINCDAAVMLYDIKNAKAAKLGDESRDDIGISSPDTQTIEIEFERDINVDKFLEVLASPMLVPLRENKVNSYEVNDKGEIIYGDNGMPAYSNSWATVATSLVCSGPFFIRKLETELGKEWTLERNKYYNANPDKEERPDKYVTPYKIIIHYEFTLDEVLEAYNNGTLFYVGTLTPDAFAEYESKLTINDTFAVGSYMFNPDSELTQNPAVRRALSLALDRNEIAKFVTASVPATGLIPPKVFDLDRKSTYRSHYGSVIESEANVDEAKSVLKAAGVSGGSITVLARTFTNNDEVGMAEYAKAQWEKLGFKVTIDSRGRNLFQTKFNEGAYDVLYTDWQAYSVRAFNMVAPFSVNYSGAALDTEHQNYDPRPNCTGYSNEDYDKLIAEAAELEEGTREKNDKVFEAEKKLMEDMPIIPLVFYRDYYMTSKEISGVKNTYYGYKVLTKMKLKNYKKYLPVEEESN
ncbi:MAG: hypothetical protein J5585_02365 [Clostridia bacterium]|nr:hypothetical protein [Clostridia bacterium]